MADARGDRPGKAAPGRKRGGGSPAWAVLRTLNVGDTVPETLYVADYANGARPRWTVHSIEVTETGSRVLVLVDPDNGADRALPGPARLMAVWVFTGPRRTFRTRPYLLPDPPPNDRLCDFDQQGRAARALPRLRAPPAPAGAGVEQSDE